MFDKKTTAAAFVVLFLSTFGGAGAAFITQSLVAHSVGPSDFGVFISALNFGVMLAPLAGCGVALFWLKSFASNQVSALYKMKSALLLVGGATFLSLLVILLWAFIGPNDHVTVVVICALSVTVSSNVVVDLVSSQYQVNGRHYGVAGITFFQPGARLLAVLAIILLCPSTSVTIENFAISYMVVSLLVVGYCCRILYRALPPVSSNDFVGDFKYIVRESSPYAIAGFFVYVYMQSDIVMLRYIGGAEEAGIYGLAYTIMSAVFLFPTVVYNRFLAPKIHVLFYQDVKQLRVLLVKGNYLMFFAGCVAVLFIFVASDFIVLKAFGDSYSRSVDVLNILSLGIPIYFVCCSAGAVLNVGDGIRGKVVYMGLVALFNVASNIVLIPFYGAEGAAYSTVASFFLLAVLYVSKSKKLLAEFGA